MPVPFADRRSFVLLALAAYGAMSGLAVAAGWWWTIDVWHAGAAATHWLRAIGYGAVAAIPLFGVLLLFDRWPPRLLRRLKRSVDDEVVPLLAGLGLAEFLVISLAAGFGEELLFRGLAQNGIAMALASRDAPYATSFAVAVASGLFGVCHWINREYAFAAGIVGVYLGVLFIVTGHLAAPITTHAVYDFLALWYLVGSKSPTSMSPIDQTTDSEH